MTARSDPLPPSARWQAELGLRMRRHLLVKVVGVSAFTWVFFLAYFHLLRHPAYPVVLMPLTTLDRLIPFQPAALFVYLTLWFYVGIAPGLLPSLRALVGYGLWVAALCAAGLAFFYFWPTEAPARTVDVTGVAGFALLQGVDAAGNACPSMHVAVAIFSALWVDRLLRGSGAPAALRTANLAWFVAIAYSTLAIRQHVVIDVAAGALLGVAFALPSLRHLGAAALPVGAAPADIIARR